MTAISTQRLYQRALDAIESISSEAEAGDGAASLTAAQAIQAALEGIAALTAFSDHSVTYYFSGVDFGAGDSTQSINTPAALRGKIKNVTLYNVTETFTDDTTQARIDIGDGVDADEFALTADFGTLAANASLVPAITDGDTPIIPVGDIVTITFVAPTGGTPAGISDVAITIDYFK